jgi:hypothetical protein
MNPLHCSFLERDCNSSYPFSNAIRIDTNILYTTFFLVKEAYLPVSGLLRDGHRPYETYEHLNGCLSGFEQWWVKPSTTHEVTIPTRHKW